jgi:hypothetical protein
MMDFLRTELIESRLFRSRTSIENQDAKQMARILYASLLVLELSRHVDKDLARDYARQTIQFGDFDHMRASVTDLANMVAVLGNQSDYKDIMNTDFAIAAPMAQIKTYLRGISMGSEQHSRDRQFFMHLESALNISDSTMYQSRRTVLDWSGSTRSERQNALSNLRREIQRHALRLDLVDFLPKDSEIS